MPRVSTEEVNPFQAESSRVRSAQQRRKPDVEARGKPAGACAPHDRAPLRVARLKLDIRYHDTRASRDGLVNLVPAVARHTDFKPQVTEPKRELFEARKV